MTHCGVGAIAGSFSVDILGRAVINVGAGVFVGGESDSGSG